MSSTCELELGPVKVEEETDNWYSKSFMRIKGRKWSLFDYQLNKPVYQPIFFFWYGSLDFTIDKVFLVTHKSDIEHWDTYVSVSVRQGWGSGASWMEAKIKFEFCIDNGAPVPQFGSINQNITLKCVPYNCEIKGFWIVYNNKALF